MIAQTLVTFAIVAALAAALQIMLRRMLACGLVQVPPQFTALVLHRWTQKVRRLSEGVHMVMPWETIVTTPLPVGPNNATRRVWLIPLTLPLEWVEAKFLLASVDKHMLAVPATVRYSIKHLERLVAFRYSTSRPVNQVRAIAEEILSGVFSELSVDSACKAQLVQERVAKAMVKYKESVADPVTDTFVLLSIQVGTVENPQFEITEQDDMPTDDGVV